MPGSAEIRIIRRPDLQKFIKPIERPRERFLQAFEATENCIALARQMHPEDSQGDWGQWNYHRGFGQGTLYVPLKNNGLLTVSLSCGGEIGQDDINKAGFVSCYAYWKTEKFSYGLIVLPGGQWYESRNHPREAVLRKFFFYQQSLGGLLSLEEFGSSQTGWFAANIAGLRDLKLQFGAEEIPCALDETLFAELLKERQKFGLVQEAEVERVVR